MPANDDRPLLLRKGPLALVSALLLIAKLGAFTVLALTPVAAELSTITTDRIIQLTNTERVKLNLAALKTNAQLMQAAREKGEHMLQEDYFAHISPTGVTPWFWMQKAGYSYQVAGENLAIDFVEAEDVVAAWLASASHKENMFLADYTETGVAAVTGEFEGGTSTIVVHMFGRPSGAVASESSSVPPAAKLQPKSKATENTRAPMPVSTPIPTPAPATTPVPRVPRIADLTFVLSPKTDKAQVAVRFTTHDAIAVVADDGTATTPATTGMWTVVAASAAPLNLMAADTAGIKVTLATVTLIPQFTDRVSETTLAAPSAYWQLARRLAAIIFILMAALLVLTIFVRIHVQHVGLITRATAVLVLAVALFLW